LAKIQNRGTSFVLAAGAGSGHGGKRRLKGGGWHEDSVAGGSSSERHTEDGRIATSIDHDAVEGPNSKKQKSESTSAEDCNEFKFLKTKGISDITSKFCGQMRMSKVEDFMSLDADDWEDPDLSFPKGWEKKNLMRLVAAGIAHYFSSGSEYQSNVQAVSDAATDSSTDRSSEDSDSDDDVALAVKNLGTLDDLVTHLKCFIGELTRDGQRHMTFCMILWIRLLKDARYNDTHVRHMEHWLEKLCKEKQIGEEKILQEIQLCVGQNVMAQCHSKLLLQVKDKIKTFQEKSCVASIAIIDHVVQDLLRNAPTSLKFWQEDVIQSCYSTSDEPVSDFLERAKDFLRDSVNSAMLLLEGFEIQRYVIFMRMPRLAACLLFGYLESCKFNCTSLPHGFCTFDSSAGQVISLTDAVMPARNGL